VIALVTNQGTAAAETALCYEHDNEQARSTIEGMFAKGEVQPKSWTNCDENDAVECFVCGKTGPEDEQ